MSQPLPASAAVSAGPMPSKQLIIPRVPLFASFNFVTFLPQCPSVAQNINCTILYNDITINSVFVRRMRQLLNACGAAGVFPA